MVTGSPPGRPLSGGPVILELPLDKIRRPLMRTRANDPQKVKELMDSISQIGLQVPVRAKFFNLFTICFPHLGSTCELLTGKTGWFSIANLLLVLLQFFFLSSNTPQHMPRLPGVPLLAMVNNITGIFSLPA